MRQFLFIMSLFSFSSLTAQRRFATEEKWSASLTGAFISLPEFNAGIQPGVGYRFNDRLSLLTEITIRIGNKTAKDSAAIDKKYFRIQPELRYYFQSKRRKREDYAGLRLSWATRKFEKVNGFYTADAKTDAGYFMTGQRSTVRSPLHRSSLAVYFPLEPTWLLIFSWVLVPGLSIPRTPMSGTR
ncbi:MAG TPA: hypothetical protein VGO58_10005 [Chitinophagaceae bacterium]|jgi:hypothetical protein|nr:hypothetical protein [Chitinophagaceae bacterium]